MARKLPAGLMELITSSWTFFKLMRDIIVPSNYLGFMPISVVKMAVQVFFNSMKGGLDAKTRLFCSTLPSV
jgi:hypothetical protein